MENVTELARKLISFNSIAPPGNERDIAEFVGELLIKNGFSVDYFLFDTNRLHLIAEKGCDNDRLPIVFSGHFDTVSLGTNNWSVNPFAGLVKRGKLYGRGSSDMKGGLAAMIIAAIQSFHQQIPPEGIRLIFTAGEEQGCLGIRQLVSTNTNLGKARGIIVGEPTGNIPAIGHKGGLYLKLTTSGTSAHSSMPHLGDNAIYKVARAITKIEKFVCREEKDPILGFPTLNVGKVSGGLDINSVPDYAYFTIDARTTVKVNNIELLAKLSTELGDEIFIETLVDLPAVTTDENSPFVQTVYSACGISEETKNEHHSLPYLTDGAVLQKIYKGAPTLILGPGQPEMAHQTDEFCYISKLEQAVEIYKKIILNKGKYNE